MKCKTDTFFLLSIVFGVSNSLQFNLGVERSLATSRRNFVTEAAGFMAFSVVTPKGSLAMSPFVSDYVKGDLDNARIAAQMVSPGKLDLNAASVSDYKRLRGFYPHAAGKIASNGPYTSVKDIYDIKGLTSRER